MIFPRAPRGPGGQSRRAVAAVEMAVLLPLLVFLCVIAVDFARVFYFSQTIANCARNGALYQSDPYVRLESPYKTLEEAVLADATNLATQATIVSPGLSGQAVADKTLAVSKAAGVDAQGLAYVEVTVAYTFRTITRFPGVPSTMTLTRTVRMAVAPDNPKS